MDDQEEDKNDAEESLTGFIKDNHNLSQSGRNAMNGS